MRTRVRQARRFRSAVTGRFVAATQAARAPTRTVSEAVQPADRAILRRMAKAMATLPSPSIVISRDESDLYKVHLAWEGEAPGGDMVAARGTGTTLEDALDLALIEIP